MFGFPVNTLTTAFPLSPPRSSPLTWFSPLYLTNRTLCLPLFFPLLVSLFIEHPIHSPSPSFLDFSGQCSLSFPLFLLSSPRHFYTRVLSPLITFSLPLLTSPHLTFHILCHSSSSTLLQPLLAFPPMFHLFPLTSLPLLSSTFLPSLFSSFLQFPLISSHLWILSPFTSAKPSHRLFFLQFLFLTSMVITQTYLWSSVHVYTSSLTGSAYSNGTYNCSAYTIINKPDSILSLLLWIHGTASEVAMVLTQEYVCDMSECSHFSHIQLLQRQQHYWNRLICDWPRKLGQKLVVITNGCQWTRVKIGFKKVQQNVHEKNV